MKTVKNTITRHGTFISEADTDKYKDIFGQINKIMSLKMKSCSMEYGHNKEDRLILRNIERDLRTEGISHMVKDKEGERFALSHQELDWMGRHDVSKWLDYLIFRYRFKMFPAQRRLLDFPIYILIEPTSICNLRCPMCFQADKTFIKKDFMGMMPWELFVNIVDQAKANGCKAITLASRGEPTLHKQFCEMLRYISDAGIMDLKINTNATRLSDDICHGILSSGVNELVFSVDAATKDTYEAIRVKGDFEAVVNNIKRFNEIRAKDYPNSPTVTRISGIYMNESQDLNAINEFWSKYVDQVVMKKIIHRWDTYNNPSVNKRKPCNFLWERMYIWYDGTVNPCDIDYKSRLAVGNAHRSSLKEIWTNEAYNKLRADHLEGRHFEHSPCDRCSVQ